MEKNKVLSMLGLATKAGKTKSGEMSVETVIANGTARLVIISEEASENTRKSFGDKCSFRGIPVVTAFSKEELGRATGKTVRTSVAVVDDGFAGALKKLLDLM